jgi:hypothetical protein
MTMKAVYRKLTGAAYLLVLLNVAYTQEVWREKPSQQWAKEDIIKLASDSPWAQLGQAPPTTGDWSPTNYIPAVTVRLRSARLMRQALLRLKQIEAKYDKMGDKEKTDFDARIKGLLECPACVDNYVVTLGPPISNRQMKSGIGSLKHAFFAQLEKRVYLMNERGERRELAHFVAPKHDDDEAVFFFPRLDEQGRPLLTPDTKKLILIIEAKNIRTGFGLDSLPEKVAFDVARMLIDGKVDF